MGKLKRIFLGSLFLLVCFLAYHYNSLIYGLQQGAGQVEVLWNAVPIKELMKDESLPDSVRQKFRFIEKVRLFAEKELGLEPTDNYTTFYDQKGKPILWIVTASPEFKIEAYEWKFPIAGGFPYKGFFDLEKAKKEEQKMQVRGFDTELDEVNAWSTLGWFTDPILSSMLSRSEGRLAELIIHESTHATLYVKDSVQFNENLASFVGRIGAESFLIAHFGVTSEEYKNYVRYNERKMIYKNYMRKAIEKLSQQYETMDSTAAIEKRRQLKNRWIDEVKEGLFKVNYFDDSLKARKRLDEFQFNNAYFSGFSTYASDQLALKHELEEEFNGDLKKMLASFKKKYKSL